MTFLETINEYAKKFEFRDDVDILEKMAYLSGKMKVVTNEEEIVGFTDCCVIFDEKHGPKKYLRFKEENTDKAIYLSKENVVRYEIIN